MARMMLKRKSMPKELWREAVACAVYFSNYSPTKSLIDVTSQESWSGLKPHVSYLKVFYVLVPKQERSKLDDRRQKVVFIGYEKRTKGYNFFNPSNNKLIISKRY